MMKSEMVNEKVKSSYIRQHKLFNDLNDEHFKEICSGARLIKLRKRRRILLKDTNQSRIYFLVSGTAKLGAFDGMGYNAVKDILVDGEIFGDFSFSGHNADEFIVGLRPNTCIFYFAVSEFKKMLQRNHQLALNYAEVVSIKLHGLEQRHSVWINKDARQRLLYFFQGWSACDGMRTETGIILDNYFALSDIADFIGVSRQFMHIMLKELKEEGLVSYSRRQIEVAYSFLGIEGEEQKLAV